MRNQKGITLIALVITIIVLLILAGVSIAMLTGQNGILRRANEADTATEKAEIVERVNMELSAQYANALAGVDFDSKETIEKNLGPVADNCEVSVTPGTSVTITVDSSAGLTVSEGSVTKSGTNWEMTSVSQVKQGS